MPCGLGQVIFSWYNSGVGRTSEAERVFGAGIKAKAMPAPVMTGVFWGVFIKNVLPVDLLRHGEVRIAWHPDDWERAKSHLKVLLMAAARLHGK